MKNTVNNNCIRILYIRLYAQFKRISGMSLSILKIMIRLLMSTIIFKLVVRKKLRKLEVLWKRFLKLEKLKGKFKKNLRKKLRNVKLKEI